MVNLFNRRKSRVRHKLRKANKGNNPRLSVFKSNSHLAVQIIDDTKGVTIASASTYEKDIKSTLKNKTRSKDAALKLAEVISERAKKAKVSNVVFDKGAYAYHGILQIFADKCRELKTIQF